MAEFWIISNFLREKSFQNVEIHKLCQAVAAQYLENEKNDLRAICVREENITLQIDVGNLKQLHQAVTEVMEVQTTSEALLNEYYDKKLKMDYDIDQQEKIYGYDEIKAELEDRESISQYEELYSRKIEMAKKMEERQIVKKYRQKEQEFLKSENDCDNLKQNLKAIKDEIGKVQATIQETILHLVHGSKELEITPAPQVGLMERRQPIAPMEDKAPENNLLIKKPGLSSRLSIIFKPSKVSSAIVTPRTPIFNPTKGLDRLLQEAEILRKSIQITPDESPPIVKPSIISKENKKEKPRKKVTFDLVTPEELPMSVESPPDEVQNSLEIIAPDVADTKQNPMVSNAKCVILENVVIKPPGTPLPIKIRKEETSLLINEPVVTPKRKIEQIACPSPQKKKRTDCDTKTVDSSLGIGDSKSFMEMFMDFSKDSTLEISPTSTTKEADAPSTSDKKKPEADEVVVIEDTDKRESSLDGFEEFFAKLTNVGSENNDNEFLKGNSFDFFDDNDKTGDNVDGEEDEFSFQF